MHPVSGLRNPVHDPGSDPGTPSGFLYPHRVASNPVCRHHVLEHPSHSSFSGAWGATLYAGVMSCGVAYTLQIVGQKNMNPTVASLILSLESCISVLAGWIILGQKLSTREIIGCVVMFGAIVLAQLPQKETASEK